MNRHAPPSSAPASTDPLSPGDRWEVRFGLALSVFAAVLALNELGASKFGDDEIQLGNEKTKAYMWFQSKSIKESVVKGQADVLDALIESGSLLGDKVATLQTLRGKLRTDLGRYKKEKDEILRGSKGVGEANWVQEVDGKFGRVVGAKEFEERQARLGSNRGASPFAPRHQCGAQPQCAGNPNTDRPVRDYHYALRERLGLGDPCGLGPAGRSITPRAW